MKPLKGIITDWKRENGRIEGKALWHADGTTLAEAFASPNPGTIANGYGIFTSPLIAFVAHIGNFSVAETRNSFYILLGKERE